MARQRPKVIWTPAAARADVLTVPTAVMSGASRAILSAGVPRIADATTPKQDAIGLLQLAAEVEHALLVQYLYAAASINPAGGAASKQAHDTVTAIAIQEMGHLLCVQNLLLALGDPGLHHLGRDEMRVASERNPLPLVLEAISHPALAKFVTVERPADIADEDLRNRVKKLGEEAEAAAHFSPHPVSALYVAIYWIFQPTDAPFGPLPLSDPNLQPGWHLTAGDFAAAADIDRFAALSDEWGGFPDLVIHTVKDAQTGCDALFAIMAQGEGVAGDQDSSHFESFLQVLDAFEANQVATLGLCRTPRVNDQPPSEDASATVLTNPYTDVWGRLFNARYTHLVLLIGHAISRPTDDQDRVALVQAALSMMRPSLAGIIRQLVRLDVGTAGGAKAGPTFGLLDDSLPADADGYWARHRELFAAEDACIAAIRARPEHAADGNGKLLLQQLAANDQALVDLVAAHPSGGNMKYAIYPPIGLARIGNSQTEFFIGPERPGSRGTQLDANGVETEVTTFKDASFRVKPQAARFTVFEIPDGGVPRPAQFPAGTTIKWTVRSVNKKDAITRPINPPPAPMKPTIKPGREDRIIDSKEQSISGASAGPVALSGTYRQTNVPLGHLRTDAAQRLLVVGGPGTSASPTNAPIGGSFYNNADWHDDVADGPVTATVTLPAGPPPVVAPAWVVVGPPDFAPGSAGVVTLYDVILQIALTAGSITLPAKPFFVDHIRPLIQRARNLRFVNNGAMWPLISGDFAALADPSAGAKQLREDTALLVRSAEDQLHDFTLREWQRDYLDKWVAGDFDPGQAPDPGPAATITRAVLDGSVGQGFFPGIEAGIIVTDPSLYAAPFDFRFDHSKVEPGDITALMALPWQADFLKCNGSWWPSQRPDVAPQDNGSRPAWLRPSMNHKRLVADVMRLGVITPAIDPQGNEVAFERGRDPQL